MDVKNERIEDLVATRNSLRAQVYALDVLIIKETEKLPMIYGRCKKRLVCEHQSDVHNTSDDTVIEVGNVIEFFRYPLHTRKSFYPSSGEYFNLPFSDEYFEFFTSDEHVDCVSFNGD